MPTFYKCEVDISGCMKTAVAFLLAGDKGESPIRHHIVLVDQSSSMAEHVGHVADQLGRFFAQMDGSDVLSIVGFSSPEKCMAYVRNARRGNDIGHALDSIREIGEGTCFSAALDLVEEITKNFPPTVATSVTIISDGNPATPWDVGEEKKRALEIAERIARKVSAINTLGLGDLCNISFLQDLSAKSAFGVFTHSADARDMSAVLSLSSERLSELHPKILEVESPGSLIMYLSGRNTKLVRDLLRLNMTSAGKSWVFILSDGDGKFKLNGETFDAGRIPFRLMRTDTKRNMMYALAYNLYCEGDRKSSLDVLTKGVGDLALADSHMASFTFGEVSRHREKLRRAVFDKSARYVFGACGADYVPKDDAVCVMDILDVLAGDAGNFYMPLPYSEYKRIGPRVVDTFNILEEGDLDDGRSPFLERLVFHKTRLNVSVRHYIRKIARLNPRAAARVGLPERLEVRLVRHQTVILDGNLHVPHIKTLVTAKTLQRLADMRVAFEVEVPEDEEGLTLVSIPLEDIPTISGKYASKNTSQILALVYEILALEIDKRVLQYFAGNLSEHVDGRREPGIPRFSPEQLEVLRDHGIDGKLNYVGVKNEVRPPTEFYEVRFLDMYIKGASSVPDVREALNRRARGEKLTLAQRLVVETYDKMRPEAWRQGRNFVRKRLREIDRKLVSKRVELASVKIAKTVTGDWFEGALPDGRGNFVYTEGDRTLVIRPGRERIYV